MKRVTEQLLVADLGKLNATHTLLVQLGKKFWREDTKEIPPETQGKAQKTKKLSCYLVVLSEAQTSPSSSALHPSFSGLIVFQDKRNLGTLSVLKSKKKRELLGSLEYST